MHDRLAYHLSIIVQQLKPIHLPSMSCGISNLNLLNKIEQLNLNDCSRLPVLIKKDLFKNPLTENEINKESRAIRNKGLLKPAKMSGGATSWSNDFFRGDQTCWLTPELCEANNCLNIKYLFKTITDICRELRGEPYIQSDLQLDGNYSMQLALYPGRNSGYVRHLDTFTDSNQAPNQSTSSRCLTFVYYLNEAEISGGNLRLYLPDLPGGQIEVEPKLVIR